MKVVIVEDETLAVDRLISLIREINRETEIVAKLKSIVSAVAWFSKNPQPDLIFMDIQLGDGLSFEIFDRIAVTAPVIFTTAFNEYALRAFKVNSIDYLLKPIDSDDLKHALEKYQSLNKLSSNSMDIQLIHQVMEMVQNPFKSRFVIRVGEHIKAIAVSEISFFYSTEKSTFLRTAGGRDFAVDGSLEQLVIELDPKRFYRVSRKHLVSLEYINDIIAYSGNRLKLNLQGANQDEILVSREKVTGFKKWLEG